MKNFIQIHGNDNVIIVLEDVVIGESIEHQAIPVTFKDDVKSGHKSCFEADKRRRADYKIRYAHRKSNQGDSCG